MAEPETTLTSTYDAFGAARGVDTDETWAFAVSWRLLLQEIAVDQVRAGLEEALAVVRETQESPEVLFGAPREHADALREQWVAEGRLVLDGPAALGWAAALRISLAMSAVFAVLLGAVVGIRGDLTEPGTVARVVTIALVVGLGSGLLAEAWSRRHRRRPPGPDVPPEQRWAVELAEILRTRYAMSGRRVRDIVAEATLHAAEAGRPVQDEFGTPTAYAARFAPDLRRRSRLTASFFAALGCSVVLPMTDGIRWTEAALMALFFWLAWRELRSPRPAPDRS